MGEEEKPQSFAQRNLHKCVVCGQVAAVLSILLLVPIIRKRRAHRHENRFVVELRRLPLVGH